MNRTPGSDNEHPAQGGPAHNWDHEEEGFQNRPIFWPIVLTIWRGRWIVMRSMMVAALLYLAAVVGLYLVAPETRTADLEVRITFDGVEKGEYPNGIPFSPQDLISSEVLLAVFEANELSNLGLFREFRNAWAVRSESAALWKLEEDYRSKLQETRLTQIDRDRLEREYNARRQGLDRSNFTLRFVRKERFRSMPDNLLEKVMTDVPRFWAELAAEKRGVLSYQIPLYTRNMIRQEVLRGQDYLISLDILRNHINRIVRNLRAMGDLPGANTIRVGEQALTLSDIQARLEDLLRFQVNPLIGLIRSTGLSRDPALTVQYLQAQLTLLDVDRRSSESRGQLYQEALRNYLQEGSTPSRTSGERGGSVFGGVEGGTPAVIPQLEGSFFDRLIEMGSKTEDVQFRQNIIERSIRAGEQMVETDREVALYRDMLEEMRKSHGGSGGSGLAVRFQEQLDGAINEVLVSLDLANSFYESISRQNLNPSSSMYSVVRGVLSTKSTVLSPLRIAVATVFYFSGVFFMICLVLIVAARLRRNGETGWEGNVGD